MDSFASFLSPGERLGPPQVALPAKRVLEVHGVTFFLVEVTPAGGSEPWAVRRRYSEFAELRSSLGLSEDSLPATPFPPKLRFLRCTGGRLEVRRQGLEAWLRELLREATCSHPQVAGPLSRFLADVRARRPEQLRAARSLFPAPEVEASECSGRAEDASPCSEAAPELLAVEEVLAEEAEEAAEVEEDSGVAASIRRRLSSLRQQWRLSLPSEHYQEPGAEDRIQQACSWHAQPFFSAPPTPQALASRHSFAACVPPASLGVEHAPVVGESFAQCARLIARDIPRTFSGNSRVDRIRLRIAEVLRAYAQKDPELGYTQGMCFAAAAVCLCDAGPAADASFESLMRRLRGLWLPGFPLVLQGIPKFQALLQEHDPEVLLHFQCIEVDLEMVLPKAWLTLFARWLPLPSLLEALPFLKQEGLPGILAVTLMLLLYHRWFLLGCQNLEEALVYLTSLPSKPPPERLMDMCTVALPGLQARIGCMEA